MADAILVPHDGGDVSDRALQRAIDFAKALHAEIILVHIVDSRFVPPSTTLGLINEKTTLEDAKKQIIRILKTGAEAMLKDRIDMTQKKWRSCKVHSWRRLASKRDSIDSRDRGG